MFPVVEALVKMRKRRKITQSEMARRLDISRNTFKNYENGTNRMPYDVIDRYLNEFGYKLCVCKKG